MPSLPKGENGHTDQGTTAHPGEVLELIEFPGDPQEKKRPLSLHALRMLACSLEDAEA